MKNSIPFLEISGSPYESGYKHGNAFKEEIAAITQNQFRYIESRARDNSIFVSRKDCLAVANKYLPYAMEYSPHLIDEIHGIADGSESSFEDIFCLNSFLDLFDLFVPSIGLSFACTSFALSTQATDSNEVFVGQCYDLSSVYQQGAILLSLKSNNQSSKLVFTIAGMVGCAGLNNYGIGLSINKLFPSDSRPGVPYTFIVRDILDQARIGDALWSILRAKRASGINYMLGDKNGEIYSLETTATDHELIYGFDGFICHANHYLTDKLKAFDITSSHTHSSIVRFSRIHKLILSKLGRIKLIDLQMFLKDHINYPFSICRHEESNINQTLVSKTISAFVIDPVKLAAHFSMGNPCENEFIEFKIVN
jgi:isopenicillin-N N-acyltransferase-like protein